jgi:hypothetical protein
VIVTELRTAISALEMAISRSPIVSQANFVAPSKGYDISVLTTINALSTIRVTVQTCVFRVGATPITTRASVGLWSFVRNSFEVEPRLSGSQIAVATSGVVDLAVTTLDLFVEENERCFEIAPTVTPSDAFANSILPNTAGAGSTARLKETVGVQTTRHEATRKKASNALPSKQVGRATDAYLVTNAFRKSAIHSASEILRTIRVPESFLFDGTKTPTPTLETGVTSDVEVPDGPESGVRSHATEEDSPGDGFEPNATEGEDEDNETLAEGPDDHGGRVSPSSAPESVDVGLIVGVVFGCVALLVILGAILWYILGKSRREAVGGEEEGKSELDEEIELVDHDEMPVPTPQEPEEASKTSQEPDKLVSAQEGGQIGTQECPKVEKPVQPQVTGDVEHEAVKTGGNSTSAEVRPSPGMWTKLPPMEDEDELARQQRQQVCWIEKRLDDGAEWKWQTQATAPKQGRPGLLTRL